MELQYVSDDQGHPTAVIVPIEEWNRISNNKMILPQKKLSKKKASDFRGIFTKEEGARVSDYINKVRSEWDRKI